MLAELSRPELYDALGVSAGTFVSSAVGLGLMGRERWRRIPETQFHGESGKARIKETPMYRKGLEYAIELQHKTQATFLSGDAIKDKLRATGLWSDDYNGGEIKDHNVEPSNSPGIYYIVGRKRFGAFGGSQEIPKSYLGSFKYYRPGRLIVARLNDEEKRVHSLITPDPDNHNKLQVADIEGPGSDFKKWPVFHYEYDDETSTFTRIPSPEEVAKAHRQLEKQARYENHKTRELNAALDVDPEKQWQEFTDAHD